MSVPAPSLLGVDADTWGRLSPMLDEALELPEEQRAAWLASLPAHAADLHRSLKRLPAIAPRTLAAASVLADEAALGSPQRQAADGVGPYRLLHALGAGGIGEVWLAERADGQLQLQVALKLPHAEALSPGLAARLARERDTLAALVHPNIARLYDAGVSRIGGQRAHRPRRACDDARLCIPRAGVGTNGGYRVGRVFARRPALRAARRHRLLPAAAGFARGARRIGAG